MPKFKVTILTHYNHQVEVEADNGQEAMDIVNTNLAEGRFDLSQGECVDIDVCDVEEV